MENINNNLSDCCKSYIFINGTCSTCGAPGKFDKIMKECGGCGETKDEIYLHDNNLCDDCYANELEGEKHHKIEE